MQQIYYLIGDFFETNIKVDISWTNQFSMPDFKIDANYIPRRISELNEKKSKISPFIFCHLNLSRCSELFNWKEKKMHIWLESSDGIKINCQDPIVKLFHINRDRIILHYTVSPKCNSTAIIDNTIRIVIEHKNDVSLYRIYSGTIIKNSFSVSVTNTYNNIGFDNYLFAEQKTLQKITSENGKHCDQSITYNKINHCLQNCLRNKMNNTYGCLFVTTDLPIILQGDEHYIQYDMCPLNMPISYKKIQTMGNDCIKLCPEKCVFVYSNVYKTKIMKNNDKSTKMIYWVTSQVSSIEKYRMDIWELIYQLGGIVGVWFGWSALSVTSIAIYVKPLIKLLKCKSIYDIISTHHI